MGIKFQKPKSEGQPLEAYDFFKNLQKIHFLHKLLSFEKFKGHKEGSRDISVYFLFRC